MNPVKCFNAKCPWYYARTIKGATDYLCTWRRYNAIAVNKHGEGKPLTPGRLVKIHKIKICPLFKKNY